MDGKFEARLSDDLAHDAKDKVLIPNCFTSGGIRFHPGVEALSSIEDRDPSGNASESGSWNAPLEKNDAIKVWQEMKHNGFLSLPACKPAPRKEVMKRKHDMASRKKKVAKIEQVNRFTKVAAAPSGLLGKMNHGIINRLRNSNQVYSIIEALVRGEKLENTQSSRKAGLKRKLGIMMRMNVSILYQGAVRSVHTLCTPVGLCISIQNTKEWWFVIWV